MWQESPEPGNSGSGMRCQGGPKGAQGDPFPTDLNASHISMYSQLSACAILFHVLFPYASIEAQNVSKCASKPGCQVFITLCMLRKAELPPLCGSPSCEGERGQPGQRELATVDPGSLETSQNISRYLKISQAIAATVLLQCENGAKWDTFPAVPCEAECQ